MFKFAVLVYQGGIATVFRVDSLNIANHGRNAKCLLEGAFDQCEAFAKGLGAAGIVVRSAYCNEAGDIINNQWKEMEDGKPPFRQYMKPVKENNQYHNPAFTHFMTVMDGCKGWYEVQENTGLPQKDCEEIYQFYCDNVL